jgi:beta-glucanase (GH16 family)
MTSMKRVHFRREKSRRMAVAVVFAGAAGCGSQDLSIGWQDTGRVDASIVSDAPIAADVATDGAVVNRDGSGDAGKFILVWRDDFDTLDPGRWELAEHTFEENYADFSAANAVAEGGFLKLGVRVKAAGSSGKPYSAAEVRTWATFACGKFLVRSRIAPAIGVTSTFFAFHDFFQNGAAQDWNELVIESATPSRIDYVYTVENTSLPGGKERVAQASALGFDASRDFHVYGLEWTPTEVRFLVDGLPQMTLPQDVVARLRRSKRLVMSAYPSTRLAPNRSFDPSGLPSEAWYDWIEVYRYNGDCPMEADGGADASLAD